MTPRRPAPSSALPAAALLFELALVTGIVLGATTPADGLASAVRATARVSLALFLLTFAAAPLNGVWTSRTSKWLVRHRRALGLATAASQGVHLALVFALAHATDGALWARIAGSTLVGGSLGYVFLAAMAATSTDRAAAWLGRPRWKALHRAGMYLLWLIFAGSYAGRAGASPVAAVATTLLLATLALRVAAALRRRTLAARRPLVPRV